MPLHRAIKDKGIEKNSIEVIKTVEYIDSQHLKPKQMTICLVGTIHSSTVYKSMLDSPHNHSKKLYRPSLGGTKYRNDVMNGSPCCWTVVRITNKYNIIRK